MSSSTGSGQNQEKKAKINESLSQFTKVTPPRKHDNEKSRKPSGGPASKSIVVHSSTSSKSYERSTSRKDSKGNHYFSFKYGNGYFHTCLHGYVFTIFKFIF